MSAFGPKRTCRVALHMSAFGGLVDAGTRKPRNTSVSGIFRLCKPRRGKQGGKQIDGFAKSPRLPAVSVTPKRSRLTFASPTGQARFAFRSQRRQRVRLVSAQASREHSAQQLLLVFIVLFRVVFDNPAGRVN